MDNLNWIPLADYSAKYKVSISTLRRRIKNEQIEYAFDNGKYFLPDLNIRSISKAKKSFSQAAPPKASPKSNHQDEGLQLGQHFFGKDFLESLEDSFEEQSETEAHNAFVSSFAFPQQQESPKKPVQGMSSVSAMVEKEQGEAETTESMKEVLDHMTKELKKAYSAILQEKEEQLFLLKEQVVDLKTLVNILESENKRLLEQQEEMQILPHVIREKVQF